MKLTEENITKQVIVKEGPTKLSRLIKRDTLNCTPEELDQALLDMNKESAALWDDKWCNKL